MPAYQYFYNAIIEHPFVFVVVAMFILAMLEKFKEILVCIITKGRSEIYKKKSGNTKASDCALDSDYINIDNEEKEE